MKNLDVRREIQVAGVRYWQVAEKLGMAPGSFSCRLRRELPEELKRKVFSMIGELKQETRSEEGSL